MDGGLAASSESDRREVYLENAYREVAAVLEEVDLAEERALADEAIAALAAIDRAYDIASTDSTPAAE